MPTQPAAPVPDPKPAPTMREMYATIRQLQRQLEQSKARYERDIAKKRAHLQIVTTNAIILYPETREAHCPSQSEAWVYGLAWSFVQGVLEIECDCRATKRCWHMDALQARLIAEGLAEE